VVSVKGKNKSTLLKMLRLFLLAICILILTVCFIASPELSVQTLLDHTPQNPVAAAAAILVLYVLKSVTVFFPLIILEIAVGHLFSHWVAFLINFIGMLIILTVPYWIGRATGMDAIQKQIQKHPKFGEILDKQQDRSFFLCFFLRVISCLPGDIVTMYLGATKTPFWKNLVAGALGVLPGMISATLMGESIQDPQSPMFWLSAGLMILLAALSVLFYYLYRRRVQTKGVSTE
jgi:uncharacterized membrane protein YdjX (TVP38/TMEM64 family)